MLQVKKAFLLFLFISLYSIYLNGASLNFIDSMHYENNYAKALQKAQHTSKPIMLVISSKTCPWCRKLERQTLKKDMINNIVSKNFIPLALNKRSDIYPKEFYPKVVPTVIFIDPKTQKQFDISYGYKNKKVFKTILLEAYSKYNKIR